jgi:predicted GNAT family acetyltransferase
LEVGWDMEPPETYLYVPQGTTAPVGWIELTMSQRDNLHLVGAGVLVHPAHRRRGHGSAMMEEVLRRVREAGRSTIWAGAPEDDSGPQQFLRRFGFAYASHDARRRQVLAGLDHAELERLYESARAAAVEYDLQRLVPPLPDEVLAELVEVTAAINDAPMGDLTFEKEKFDVARLRDIETALLRRGNRGYRVVARHRTSGEAAGHTWVALHPAQPTLAEQGDTAVARQHRGHRLGLLLKLEMMRWLGEVEPQIEVIETWNHADNSFMISVNELIGYRLSRVFNMYELNLAGPGAAGTPTAATRARSERTAGVGQARELRRRPERARNQP